MCRSKEDGGGRCFPVAERRYTAAVTKGASSPESPGHEAFLDAELDYAATPKGGANLRMLHEAALAAADFTEATRLKAVLRAAAERQPTDAALARWGRPPASAGRCSTCGQYSGQAHQCPPALVRERTMRSNPAETADGADGRERLHTALFDVPMTDDQQQSLRDEYGDVDAATMQAKALAAAYDNGENVENYALAEWAHSSDQELRQQLYDATKDLPDEEILAPGLVQMLGDPSVDFYVDRGGMLLQQPFGSTVPVYAYAGSPSHYDIDELSPVSVEDARVELRKTSLLQTQRIWVGGYVSKPGMAQTFGEFTKAAAEGTLGRPEPGESLAVSRMRIVAKAQYEITQRFFAERGISHVHVYRGYGKTHRESWQQDTDDAYTARVPLSTASSFTLDERVARMFASWNGGDNGVVISGTVPVSRIAATPRTGIGCFEESEVVVIDGPGKWTVKRLEEEE